MDYRCTQCKKSMTVVDYLVNEVCLECCRRNQRRVTRQGNVATITPQKRKQLKLELSERTKVRRRKENARRANIWK